MGLNATAVKVASGAADTRALHHRDQPARALREMQEAGVWVLGAARQAEKSIYTSTRRAR